MLFDDGAHAYAAGMGDNRMRLHGVTARSAQRVEYLLEERGAAGSLTDALLQRLERDIWAQIEAELRKRATAPGS